jgi:non-specific protein-tyrosine kinase
LEVRRYIDVIKERWRYIFAAIVIITGSTLLFSLVQEPVYQGETRVLLTAQNPGTLLAQLQLTAEKEVQTQVNLITLRPLLEQVIESQSLGITPDDLNKRVTVTGVVNTSLISIRVKDNDAERAAAIANGLAEAYVNWSRTLKRASIAAAAEQIEIQLADVQKEVQALVNTKVSADQAASHQARVETALARQAALAAQLEQLKISEQLEVGSASIVAPATVDTEAISPKPTRNTVLAFVVSTLFGVGLAFIVDYLDDTIGSADEAAAIYGAPILGQIPVLDSAENSTRALAVFDSSRSPMTESYRLLRSSLEYVNFEHDFKTLIVTSATPAEGKSTVAANLAAVLARAGNKTVLLEADFVRPVTHEFFGVGREVGLSNVLTGAIDVHKALKRPEDLENLWVLTAGSMPPNSSELLGSETMKRTVASLAEWADWIIVDTPPNLAVADTTAVARWTDGVMLVIREGSTTRVAARSSLEALGNIGAKLVGVVITGAQDDKISRGSYASYFPSS